MQRILQAVQDGINLFAGNNQWRLDTHNSRIIEGTRYEYTTLEEAGGDGIANIIIDKVLPNQQTFTGDLCIHVAMTRRDIL